MSPGLKAMLIERIGAHVQQAGAPFLFAPPEGPAFFDACGWKAVEVTSMLKTARKLDRLPIFLRMMAMLPESAGPQGSRPWSGCFVFERTGSTGSRLESARSESLHACVERHDRVVRILERGEDFAPVGPLGHFQQAGEEREPERAAIAIEIRAPH